MMNAHNVTPKMKYDINTFINKVRVHEGLVLTVYKDTLGIDTIGIGRNLKDRGISKEELDYMDSQALCVRPRRSTSTDCDGYGIQYGRATPLQIQEDVGCYRGRRLRYRICRDARFALGATGKITSDETLGRYEEG